MNKRKPPKVGDLVCLTYNTNTIGIVIEVSDWTGKKYRYRVQWLKDNENVLKSRHKGVNFGHYCDSVLIPLEEICK